MAICLGMCVYLAIRNSAISIGITVSSLPEFIDTFEFCIKLGKFNTYFTRRHTQAYDDILPKLASTIKRGYVPSGIHDEVEEISTSNKKTRCA